MCGPCFVVKVVMNDFANEHINEIVAIAPRTECLETPIKTLKEET